VFKQVMFANIGDGHACGQKPITFLRQVFVNYLLLRALCMLVIDCSTYTNKLLWKRFVICLCSSPHLHLTSSKVMMIV